MFKNTNPKQEPIWQKEVPAIPVRENMKTTYVHLSSMHGDRLPKLRTIERPEFSDQARHFKNVSESSMTKNMNIMYKEHQHTMKKLMHNQESAFKEMCKVHKAKRNAQRSLCFRRQRELQGKMKSHRIRALLLNVIIKFRENVSKNKSIRERDEKKRLEQLLDSGLSVKKNRVLTETDEYKQRKLASKSPKRENLPDVPSKLSAGSDQETPNKSKAVENVYRERKGSLTGEGNSIKPAVRTAENRERWDTGNTRGTDAIREEASIQRRTAKVMEVTRLESKSVTKRKGSVSRESRQVITRSQNDRNHMSDESVAIESPIDRCEQNRLEESPLKTDDTRTPSSMEMSALYSDEGRDYGWFTVGNPLPDNTDPWTGEKDVRDNYSEDIHSERRTTRSLPPLRRKTGVIRPPDAYLREQMNTHARESTGSRTSSRNSTERRSRFSTSSQPLGQTDIEDAPRTDRSMPYLFPVSPSYANSRGKGSLKTTAIQSEGEGDADAMPSDGVEKQPEAILRSGKYINRKLISASQSSLLPVNTSLKGRKLAPRKNKFVSANMMWVLKQEHKSRQQWQKHMSDDDLIFKYHRDKEGNLVAKLASRRTHFTPPSQQEQYRQQKLLVGEKVLSWEYRDRMEEFYKNIVDFPKAESTRTVIADIPPSKILPPRLSPPVTKPAANKFGNIFEAYRQRDMAVDADPHSYEAMKGVSYLRGKDNSNEKIQN